MTTFWIKFLGYELLKDSEKQEVVMGVPYVNLVLSLFALTTPLLVGIAIARYKPSWANNARKVIWI